MSEAEHIDFRKQIIFWSITLVLFALSLFLLKAVLLPFVLGIAIAYLLNPLVQKFGHGGVSRKSASLVMLFGFFAFLTLVLALVTPIAYRELTEFSQKLPNYIDSLKTYIEPYIQKFESYLGQGKSVDLSMLTEHLGSGMDTAKALLSGLSAGGQALTSFVTVIAVTPIVAYFMMKEWPYILRWCEDLLPRHHKKTILGLLKDIDGKVAGFIRGQIIVAFILGIAYAIALSVLGLQYGFIFGLTAGLLNIIPLVGSSFGLIVGAAMAWFQTGDLIFVGMVGGVFVLGQVVEGNILTPKLVGDSVGLHPLWIFFALMAGGALLGITGMFLAVPLAASLGVLIGFMLDQYKQSPYYKGPEPEKKKPGRKPGPKKKNANA